MNGEVEQSMMTEATLRLLAAQVPDDICRFTWHDGKSGHSCRGLKRGHHGPHKCSYAICTAVYRPRGT